MNSFWVAALIVVIMWTLILGLYLSTTRRQAGLRSQMEALDKQLSDLEMGVDKR